MWGGGGGGKGGGKRGEVVNFAIENDPSQNSPSRLMLRQPG